MQIRNGTFLLGESRMILAGMAANSIDGAVTSPPYDDMRTYNGSLNDWNYENFCLIAREIVRVLKPGAMLVWNVGDATVDGGETGSSFKQVLFFQSLGMLLADTMIWEKTGSGALGSQRIYGQNFEYMFCLSKGKHSTFNPIKDRENIIKAGFVSTNGGLVEGKGPNRVIERKPFGKRTNIWRINQAQKSFHPAPFPESLARDHIVTWSNPGDVILDPFGGSGTTAVAAENCGRRGVCIERDESYYWQAVARVLGI